MKQMITERQGRERVKKGIDPELNINIVDLGVIYKIRVTSNKKQTKIYILMTLTTPGCPLAGMFDALVKHSLRKLAGIDVDKDIKIELTFDPPWTAEMMSEGARAELGF